GAPRFSLHGAPPRRAGAGSRSRATFRSGMAAFGRRRFRRRWRWRTSQRWRRKAVWWWWWWWKGRTIMAARTWMAAVALTAGIALIPGAAQTGQKTFATPQEAAQALVDAANANDTAAMLRIFGPAGKDIVQSGDAAADKESRENFAALAHQKMQVELDEDKDRATLIVGPDDWPLPVPIILEKGQWRFHSAVGRVEVLARRVGRNELTAMDVCRAYVEAQMEYASRDRSASGTLQYAQKILSSPGKKDGLYWEGESDNLVPKAFADASAAMDYVVKDKMIGSFALAAYPAEYGVSGIQTFVVNHRGKVYEKDLGPTTGVLARQMAHFNPGKNWKVVAGEEERLPRE